MTVLVTGGCGYLGDHLVLALLEQQRHVVVVDRAAPRFPIRRAGVTYIGCDINDDTALNAVFENSSIDQVVHLAASIDVSESIANPQKYQTDNVDGTRGLVEACLRHNVSDFLFASTAAVYGQCDHGAIGEDTPCQPVSPYGQTKLQAENYLLEMAANGFLRPLIYRHFNAAGADSLGRSGPRLKKDPKDLVRSVCRTALGINDQLTIYGNRFPTPDGTCVRDFVHVSDVAEAQIMGLNHLQAGGSSNIFNIGSGRGTSVQEVVIAVEAMIHPNRVKVVMAPPRLGEIIVSVSDTQKFCAAMNWSPRRSDVKTIVHDAMAWERTLITDS